MSRWNYRIVRGEDGVLSVREVGYDTFGSPYIIQHSEHGLREETVGELAERFDALMAAPVLAERGEELVEEGA